MGLGMPEVILILVIALIVFGPRKLPELGKSLGQAMQQFRRASDDFKRTWEQEVEMEKYRKTDSAGSSSSYEQTASNEYYDPYNPYSEESDSGNQNSLGPGQSEAANAAQTQETAQTESAVAAGAGASATANEPKQQHWI